ncbi:hypothetical protein K9M79_02155 [Candidatus Woesearchaeota archaeon]|nr:hypothetical protein [Candidatus Woesearchaeota archaeon]
MQILKRLTIHNPSDIVIGHHTCTMYGVSALVYRYSEKGKVTKVNFKDGSIYVALLPERQIKTIISESLLFDYFFKKRFIRTSNGPLRSFYVPNKKDKSIYVRFRINKNARNGTYYVRYLISPIIDNHIILRKQSEIWQEFHIHRKLDINEVIEERNLEELEIEEKNIEMAINKEGLELKEMISVFENIEKSLNKYLNDLKTLKDKRLLEEKKSHDIQMIMIDLKNDIDKVINNHDVEIIIRNINSKLAGLISSQEHGVDNLTDYLSNHLKADREYIINHVQNLNDLIKERNNLIVNLTRSLNDINSKREFMESIYQDIDQINIRLKFKKTVTEALDESEQEMERLIKHLQDICNFYSNVIREIKKVELFDKERNIISRIDQIESEIAQKQPKTI